MDKFVKYKKMWWKILKVDANNKAKLLETKFSRTLTVLNDIDITDLPVCSAKNEFDLDWYNTNVWDNNCKTGWVDRKGVFYGCDFAYHDMHAIIVHHHDRFNLEQLGYVHISIFERNGTGKCVAEYSGDYIHKDLKPTDAQIKYLLTRNDVDSSKVKEAYFFDKQKYQNRLNQENFDEIFK